MLIPPDSLLRLLLPLPRLRSPDEPDPRSLELELPEPRSLELPEPRSLGLSLLDNSSLNIARSLLVPRSREDEDPLLRIRSREPSVRSSMLDERSDPP